MSQGELDEFVIFPSSENSGVTKLDIGHTGSHDPRCLDASGRQHRPTGPVHEALIYREVVEDIGPPGPGHEGESGMGNVSAITGGPPGILGQQTGQPRRLSAPGRPGV